MNQTICKTSILVPWLYTVKKDHCIVKNVDKVSLRVRMKSSIGSRGLGFVNCLLTAFSSGCAFTFASIVACRLDYLSWYRCRQSVAITWTGRRKLKSWFENFSRNNCVHFFQVTTQRNCRMNTVKFLRFYLGCFFHMLLPMQMAEL